MKIVVLDTDTLGQVKELEQLSQFGEVIFYPFTLTEEDTIERIKDAQIVLTNKVKITQKVVDSVSELKLVCVTATGTNNIDFEATKKANIEVCNVSGYSTNSVAQHTFSMLFYLIESLPYYDNYVKEGTYQKSPIFTNISKPFWELTNKTFGIIGLGTIGQKVASIATVFGAKVIYYSTTGKNNNQTYQQVSLEELLKTSDVVSIHAPLTNATNDLIGKEELALMQDHSILLNTGRGGIINEEALAKALNKNQLAGAGIDVLVNEPILETNPLLKIADKSKIIITPHIAWSSQEAREELVKLTIQNINKFLNNGK